MTTFHSVLAFNAATSKPAEAGERLVVIHYKGKKINANHKSFASLAAAGATIKTDDSNKQYIEIDKFPSLCVSVPPLGLNLSSLPTTAADVTLGLWASLQDTLIKNLIDARRSKDDPAKTTKHSISDDEISIAAIVSLAASTGNGKLSGDSIGQWFDSILAECLTTAILEKNATVDDATIATLLSNYRAGLSKLAAVVPGLPDSDYEQLRKAIAYAPESDAMADRLIAKIDSATKEKQATLVTNLL